MNNWLTCESDTFWFGSVAGSRYSTILLLSIGSIKAYKIKSKIVFYKIYLQIITVHEGSTNYTYPTKIGSGFGSGSRSEEKARIRIQHTASNCWLQKNGLHLFSTKMSFFSAASFMSFTKRWGKVPIPLPRTYSKYPRRNKTNNFGAW